MRIGSRSDSYTKQETNNITNQKQIQSNGKGTGYSANIHDSNNESTTNIIISEEAIELFQNNNAEEELKIDKDKKFAEDLARLKKMLEQTKETNKATGEATSKSFNQRLKCIKIAMRIAKGDKVPTKDMQYLMMNHKELYMMAMSMIRYKKDPKEWESELKDEGKNAENKSGNYCISFGHSISLNTETEESEE